MWYDYIRLLNLNTSEFFGITTNPYRICEEYTFGVTKIVLRKISPGFVLLHLTKGEIKKITFNISTCF